MTTDSNQQPGRLRITYLITSILGITGGNQTLLRQAEELRRRGHEVTIVTYSPKPKWCELTVRVLQVPQGQTLAQAVPPSDVVIATYFLNAHELPAIQAPVKVYQARGDQFVFGDATMADTAQNRRFRELSRASYRLPGIRFVPNSHNLATAVERQGGRRPDAILPVCVDQAVFRPLQRALPGSRVRLLIVGPDSRGSQTEPLLFKGIQDIQEALQLLAPRFPQFTAVRMSGSPPEIFRHFPCEFYQAPSEEMKTVLYGTANILLYASHYDSCPRPPLEAMAAGCAVVCTATTGALEYCREGENALLVPIQAPAAIAAATERLLHDSALREKLVQGGLATAAQRPREREWDEWEALLTRFVAEAADTAVQAAVPAMPQPSTAAKPAKSAPLALPACGRVGFLGPARDLLARKKPREAWEATLAALHLRPFHPEAYLLLAEIAASVGDGQSARACAAHARRLAPGFKPARQFLNRRLSGSTRPNWLTLPEALRNPEANAQPRLSVCLITKNEERFLGQCLQSIRDLAHQIVVVDTGSTDRTVALAQEHGAEVHHFAWCDDFSAARNAALEHATGDWILVLDADEELAAKDREALRAHLQDAAAIGWRLPLLNVGYEAVGCAYVPRLFRNAPGLFFIGRVHEQIFGSVEVRRAEWGLENRLGEATLLHHGYTSEVMQERKKVERNLALLEQAVLEQPDQPHLLMNLGLELSRSGREAEGLERYRQAFQAMSAQKVGQVTPEGREALLTQFSARLTAARQFEELVRVLTSPLAQLGRGLNASLHYALGVAQIEVGQLPLAIEQLECCLAKRSQPSLAPIYPEINSAVPYGCLALCHKRLGAAAAAEQAYQAGLQEKGCGDTLRLDYAQFLVEQDRPVEALQRLHEVVAENAQHLAAWRLGGHIALSRAEFLEFARDWTHEAITHLPEDDVLTAQRAEALLLSQDPAGARALWERLWNNDRHPVALAALLMCELGQGAAAHAPQNEAEAAAVTRAFIEWYRKCINAGAREVVVALNAHTVELRSVLPEAARILEAVNAAAGQPAPAEACVA
jgi:glycosyltransferase involved in cell wall biosynthesis/Tfp pilus assembly protein PilF